MCHSYLGGSDCAQMRGTRPCTGLRCLCIGWIVFRLPHDPYNGGSEKENAVSLDHLKYGTRLRFVCLAR